MQILDTSVKELDEDLATRHGGLRSISPYHQVHPALPPNPMSPN